MLLEKKSFNIGLFISEEFEAHRIMNILIGFALVDFVVYDLRECGIDKLSKTISRNNFDLYLLDINLGIQNLEEIQQIVCKENIAKLVIYLDLLHLNLLPKCLELCSMGVILKGVHEAEIIFAISAVLNGGLFISPTLATKFFQTYQQKGKILRQFSPKELLVVNGLVDGSSYKQIAEKNQISINTVRDYVKKIYRKLNIQSKGQLLHRLHEP